MGRINKNQALNTSFKLEIPGLNEVNYFIQSAQLPSISMGGIEAPKTNNAFSVPSNRVEYDPLNMIMLVDEDFENHKQIQIWMHKYAKGSEPINSVHKDILFHVLNSNKVPIMTFKFYGSYPTILGEVSMESGTTDAVSLICTVNFRYQAYERL